MENMESKQASISFLGRLLRYLLHGLVLAVVVLTPMIFGVVTSASAYILPQILMGPLFATTIMFGMIFILLGGANHSLSKKLWGHEFESDLGTGMRDGFVLFVIFNIAYSPIMMAMMRLSVGWGLHTVTPFDVFLLFLVTTPIYLLLFGFIGERFAVFLNLDKEPIMPTDFQERSFKCSHCGSSYYYSSEIVRDGRVACQNCGKQFEIN